MAKKIDKNILVITPIKHIPGVYEMLSNKFNLFYYPDFQINDLNEINNKNFYAIYTNPNKSKTRIDSSLIEKIPSLKYVVTASTGTNHIDKEFLKGMGIKIISLTKDLKTIKTISSTAEHSFALTLMALRNIDQASSSVIRNEWDYLPYVGRQMNKLNVLIVGYGRLGKMYYKYAKAFGASIDVVDPFLEKKSVFKNINFVSLKDGVKNADVIALHVHHTDETENLINTNLLKLCKKSVLIVNTSRGEIVNEDDIINFLKNNRQSKYYTDVIANEIVSKNRSLILKENKLLNNLFITPHIGGMTIDAQEIAFGRVANKLIRTIDNA